MLISVLLNYNAADVIYKVNFIIISACNLLMLSQCYNRI